jgi:hypothetical protein
MVQGSPAFRVRTSDRGNALETAFCGICSTALYSGSSARPRIRTIYVGTLDRAADVEVRAHIWTR